MSSTTPTTVRRTSGRERGCGIVVPTGDAPGVNARTNAPFTMTTGGDPVVSRAVKSRPDRSVVAYAANHPGVTKLKAMRVCESPIRVPPSTGVQIEPPACATPGTPRTASRSRSNRRRRPAASVRTRAVSTVTTSTRSGSKPSGTLATRAKDRTSNADPMTSASDSAIWAMTRLLDTVARPRIPTPDADSARTLRTSTGAIRVDRNAGSAPKMLAVTRAIAAVNAITRQSNDRSIAISWAGVDNCATRAWLLH